MTDNLTLAVVGATGRTGVPLVQQALDRGHRVRALVRDPDKARTLLPPEVETVVGDARDPHAITRLVSGADLVLDVSGPVKGGAPDYRTESTRALLTGLADQPGTALVHLTGAGVRRPADTPKPIDTMVRGIMRVVASALLADSTAAVELLDGSAHPSLVVRAPRLTDKPGNGAPTLSRAVGHGGSTQVSRSDLAGALLDLAVAGPSGWPTGSPLVSA